MKGVTAVKLSLDSANLDEIREANRWGVLGGVTTNPSLVAKEGTDFLPLEKEICSIVNGPVSIETAGDDTDLLIKQGHEIADFADNAVVKVACTPNGLAATKHLADEDIKVNMTLVFSPTQAILAAEAGAYIVSPFLGRLDDIATDSLKVLSEICEIYEAQDYETKVLAASIRHQIHVAEAAKVGADIATMPFKVFESLVKHPLTDQGFEKFSNDWEKAKSDLGELFPSMQEA
jgi:transaldolase